MSTVDLLQESISTGIIYQKTLTCGDDDKIDPILASTVDLLQGSLSTRDATIHNLDVSIYCHLCITIQRYIARYNQV